MTALGTRITIWSLLAFLPGLVLAVLVFEPFVYSWAASPLPMR